MDNHSIISNPEPVVVVVVVVGGGGSDDEEASVGCGYGCSSVDAQVLLCDGVNVGTTPMESSGSSLCSDSSV